MSCTPCVRDPPLTHVYRFQNAPTVKLIVGESKVSFEVHKDLLCRKSSVFNATFNINFKETADQTVSLPDDDAETVDRFTQWMYTATYSLASFDSLGEAQDGYLQLAQLYVFADKIQVYPLKNEIVQKLFDLRRNKKPQPQMPIVTFIYQNSNEKSAFRKLLVAWYVWHTDFAWYEKPGIADEISCVPEFAAELAIAFAQRHKEPYRKSPFEGGPEQCYETVEYGKAREQR